MKDGLLTFTMSPKETSSLVAQCRQHGVSVTGALLAAFLLAQVDAGVIGTQNRAMISVSVNIRDWMDHSPGRAVGMYASSIDMGSMRPPRVRAQCWRPPSRQRSSRLRRHPKLGWTLPRPGTKPKARVLPRATPNSVGAVSVGCTCVFLRPLRPEHFVFIA